MSKFKQEDVHGVVRNDDKTHTVVLKDGERVKIDEGETSSLLNRLDKDRSRMEREGTRANQRAQEKEYESNRRYNPEERARERYERDAQMRRELARRGR